LHLNSLGEWRYICRLAGRRRCRAYVIRKMSGEIMSGPTMPQDDFERMLRAYEHLRAYGFWGAADMNDAPASKPSDTCEICHRRPFAKKAHAIGHTEIEAYSWERQTSYSLIRREKWIHHFHEEPVPVCNRCARTHFAIVVGSLLLLVVSGLTCLLLCFHFRSWLLGVGGPEDDWGPALGFLAWIILLVFTIWLLARLLVVLFYGPSSIAATVHTFGFWRTLMNCGFLGSRERSFIDRVWPR
jgi:hypothetical protein